MDDSEGLGVRSVFCRIASQIALALVTISVAAPQERRPLEVTDLATWEQLGPVAPSPDGTWLAVVIARPRTGGQIYRDLPGGPRGAEHSDIWLVHTRSGEVRNITQGSVASGGYWSPSWSPDGRRLAMLSTKSGENVSPFLWDMASSTLSQLSTRGFELQAVGDQGWPAAPLLWSDSTTLVMPLRPEAAPPTYYGMSRLRSIALAPAAWERAAQGEQATASVLDTSPDSTATALAGDLIAMDVVSGRTRVLASGNLRRLLRDPSGRRLALIAMSRTKAPATRERLRAFTEGGDEWWHTRLGLLGAESRQAVQWLDPLYEPITGRFSLIGDHPHSWAPDGSSLAVVVKSSQDRYARARVTLLSSASGQLVQQRDSLLEVKSTGWSTGGDLLSLARSIVVGAPDYDSGRFDWHTIDVKTLRARRNLTESLRDVPTTLIRTAAGHTVLGLAGGELWSINVRTGSVTSLTESIGPALTAVVWPTGVDIRLRPQSVLVLEGADRLLYRLQWDGTSARTSVMPSPSLGARLVVYQPATGLRVFSHRNSNGSFLWVGEGSASFKEVLALNRHAAQIADARRMLVEYRGADGDSLRGVLLLPVDYVPGKRVPLVAWVYPGLVYRDTLVGELIDKQSVTFLNLYLLTARGYGVLLPSIPLGPEDGTPSDPYLDIPKSVLPSVERVIELGIADPERLAVLGHSYGGYGVLTLLTSTRRFKTGIAIAAPTDLASLYGTIFPFRRYEPHPLDEMFFSAHGESGQFRMGAAPWRDPVRYIRNSPYYMVERLQTPVMLIQGDIDYVPMAQGEQFYTAVHRLGKRARFVRYWGEGHVITSPANVRDMWARIYAWLGEYLGSDESAPKPSKPVSSIGAGSP